MEDIALLKSELAMYGIKVDGDKSLIYRGNKEMSMPVGDMLQHLKKEVATNKIMFYSLWDAMNDEFQSYHFMPTASNESTQRMFIAAVKHLYNMSRQIRMIMKYARLMHIALSQDINVFNETFMSNIVDFSIGINWADNLVCSDMYRIKLLTCYIKEFGITAQTSKTAAYMDENTDINGVQGPWSNFDLNMKERVWSFSEDAEDFEDSTRKRQNSGRYDLPETYNKPGEFEQGFYWREPRNDPYRFDDESANPYPHDKRWFKTH